MSAPLATNHAGMPKQLEVELTASPPAKPGRTSAEEQIVDIEPAGTEGAQPAWSASLSGIMARLEALEAARTEVVPLLPAGSDSLEEINARLEALEAARREVAPAPPNRGNVAQETVEVAWAFVGRLYCTFTAQFIVSAGVAIIFFKFPCILHFFNRRTILSWGIYVSLLLSAPAACYAMLKYRKRAPYNIALLALFNIAANVAIHLLIPTKGGNLMVLITLLSTSATITLIIFSVWARWASFKLSFGVPALVGCTAVVVTYVASTFWNPLQILKRNPHSLIFGIFISTVMVYAVNQSTATHNREEIIVAAINVYVQLLNEVGSRASLSFL